MLDQPRDAVLQKAADGVGDERQGVQARAYSAQRAVDPRATMDACGDLLDVLGDPDACPRGRPVG
jgi:hypothetical protein